MVLNCVFTTRIDLLLKQAIEKDFATRMCKPEIIQEPYRHLDFRVLVMSPLTKPQVAQPTIGNLLPVYLTKETAERDRKRELGKGLRTIGSPPFRQFLVDIKISALIDETAVPQRLALMMRWPMHSLFLLTLPLYWKATSKVFCSIHHFLAS